METWLVSRGLGRFYERLQEFGIESIHDLLDSDIVSDVELRREIGMNPAEIIKFRSSVNENRVMDWSHLDAKSMQRVEKAVDSGNKDPGKLEYALFVRKLQRSMLFERFDKHGKKHSCVVHMGANNQSMIFGDGTKRIELLFEALRGVHGFLDDETMRPKYKDLEEFAEYDDLKNGFLLTFHYKEDSVDSGKGDKAPLLAGKDAPKEASKDVEAPEEAVGKAKARSRWGSALQNVRKEVQEKRGGPARPDWASLTANLKTQKQKKEFAVKFSLLEIAIKEAHDGWYDPDSASEAPHGKTSALAEHCTTNQGGLLCVFLVCKSREDKVFAAKGLRHCQHFYAAGESINSKLHKHAGICAQKWPNWLRGLEYFHHLYRPHHHHNHPPQRFHNEIVAEVSHDPSFEIVLLDENNKQLSKLNLLDNPVFKQGMFVRAKIKRFDVETQSYSLKYRDGPYLGDEEADGTKLLKLPKGSPKANFVLQGVKGTFVTVDLFDNYGSALPIFIVLTSLVQALAFAKYVTEHPDEPLTSHSPIAGPEGWWMRIMGDFPECQDVRGEYTRLVAYQLVHAGYRHVVFNLIMQLLFGLPLNMVHGNLRFGILYNLGVIGGALTYAALGGGHGALVGASGGVYAIFGMHVAEIIINWDVASKGIMNHWTRLMVIGFILGLDAFLYYTDPSEATSYTAHVGGWAVGLIMGILLLDNLELEWCEKYLLFPLTWLLAIGMCVLLPALYLYEFPPKARIFVSDALPCCFQLYECGIEQEDFGYFRCVEGYYIRTGRKYAYTCDAFESWVEERHERLGVS